MRRGSKRARSTTATASITPTAAATVAPLTALACLAREAGQAVALARVAVAGAAPGALGLLVRRVGVALREVQVAVRAQREGVDVARRQLAGEARRARVVRVPPHVHARVRLGHGGARGQVDLVQAAALGLGRRVADEGLGLVELVLVELPRKGAHVGVARDGHDLDLEGHVAHEVLEGGGAVLVREGDAQVLRGGRRGGLEDDGRDAGAGGVDDVERLAQRARALRAVGARPREARGAVQAVLLVADALVVLAAPACARGGGGGGGEGGGARRLVAREVCGPRSAPRCVRAAAAAAACATHRPCPLH